MAAIGAKIRWLEGKLLHASRLWKSPSKRRIPRLMVEDRAMEVGILMHIEEPWMIFEETTLPAQEIEKQDATELEFYLHRYHLLPETFKGKDTFEWLCKPGKRLLLWSDGSRYYVKEYTQNMSSKT